MLPIPVTHFKKASAPADRTGAAEVDHDQEEGQRPERVVVCASCGHPVAKVADRIEMDGRHRHTCVNPASYVYRIGCYRRAAGCIGEGSWSDLYTWFAGTFWQLACCARCGIHLGWAFTGEREDFHGLIVDRIVEQDANPGGSGRG